MRLPPGQDQRAWPLDLQVRRQLPPAPAARRLVGARSRDVRRAASARVVRRRFAADASLWAVQPGRPAPPIVPAPPAAPQQRGPPMVEPERQADPAPVSTEDFATGSR